jgi:hypothetical protein
MSRNIRINNYFFDNVTDYTPDKKEIGTTNRMPNGTVKTQYTTEYYTFKLKLENVKSAQLGQLLYLENLCKSINDDEEQNLKFYDDTDGSALGLTFPIDVTIPINGFDFNREKGEEETYEVDLTLEQVL